MIDELLLIHPCEYVREAATMKFLMEHSNLDKETIQSIACDTSEYSVYITEEIAEELGKAFGTGKEFWVNLQKNYDAEKEKLAYDALTKEGKQ